MSTAGDLDRSRALRRVRAVIEGLIAEGTVVARSDGTLHRLFPVAASVAEGEALRGWVVREGATRTIEIGLGYGISALHVCEGLLANASEAAAHHAEESQLARARLLGVARVFDLAFVDGNHRFDGVFVDLVYLGRLVRPGGIVFLDNYQLPAVARAVSFFLTNLSWTLEEVSAADDHHRWEVLRTSAVPDARAFDFYVEF